MKLLPRKKSSLSEEINLNRRQINVTSFLDHFSNHDNKINIDNKISLENYFNSNFEVRVKKCNKLKRLLRNPKLLVDTNSRITTWLSLFGGFSQISHSESPEFDNFDVEFAELSHFVAKDLETNYFLNEKGRGNVRRIMFYFAYIYPNFSYCPLLFYLSTVFSHYFCPSVSVGILQKILENRDFYGIGFSNIMNGKLNNVHKHFCGKFSKSGFDLSPDWISSLFCLLPLAYVVRILDCYAFEGIKVIVRFGVAVAHYVGKFGRGDGRHLYNNHNSDLESWKRLFSTKITLKKLFRKAFKMSISMSKIHSIMEIEVRKDSFASDSVVSRQSSKDYQLAHKFFCLADFSAVESRILTIDQLKNIWSWLPYRMLTKNPELIFTTRDHGWSLKTFYSKCAKWDHVIVAYEVVSGEKFGFFSPVELTVNHGTSFYGTGETFIFTMFPTVRKYPWVGTTQHGRGESNDMFIAGDINLLIVGGGGGEAIFIQDDLFEGRSERCDTFDNDPLVEGCDFVCKIVEVLGLR